MTEQPADSIWFHLLINHLKSRFNDPAGLVQQENRKHACVAAILRLCPSLHDNDGSNNVLNNLNSNHPSSASQRHPHRHSIGSKNNNAMALELLYIQRAIRSGDRWSGQIAFVGGRSEAHETLQQTVVRETKEEIGLNLDNHRQFICLGYSSVQSLKRATISLNVVCFVYFQCCRQTPPFRLEAKEVANVAWIHIGSQLCTKNTFASTPDANATVDYKKTVKIREKRWETAMANSVLIQQMHHVFYGCDTNHINLILKYKNALGTKLARYPGILLRVFKEEEEAADDASDDTAVSVSVSVPVSVPVSASDASSLWLLWGVTYRMTFDLLQQMQFPNALRKSHLIPTRFGALPVALWIMARQYFGVVITFELYAIEPYFSESSAAMAATAKGQAQFSGATTVSSKSKL